MEQKEKVEQKGKFEQKEQVMLVRILGKDVRGDNRIYSGLTKIKGVSWAMANSVCLKLGFKKNDQISELKKEDIARIEEFLKNPDIPDYMKNRRKDFDTGEDKHLVSVELSMRNDFDIKRLKKIKSYRGMRHSLGLPSRGQRTRSHFRGKGKAVGVKKPKSGKKS